ncbi:MAG: methionyl-tRNA formyltransferase [Marinagarivorans sp.]|nr:methionyl-tRNA formyltransferase [Marinagarivorans sp.]
MSATQPLRIIFAGTPEFAAIHLQYLINSHHQVVAVYTQPDRPAGRGKKLQASPVKQCALDANIPVCQPARLKDIEEQDALRALDADLMIVVAYGLLLPQAVLDAPKYGCFNVHGSILPRWRGAAPIQRSIEAGDTETGITIMQMDAGLDTGAMLYKVICPITQTDTASSLHDKLAELGPKALAATLEQLCSGILAPEAQNNALATYAYKLSKEEGSIDWQQGTATILRKIRAFIPFPVCHSVLAGEALRVFAADKSEHTHAQAGTITSHQDHTIHVATGDGAIAITLLQLPGKKTMSSRDILNGMADKFAVGLRLGSQ